MENKNILNILIILIIIAIALYVYMAKKLDYWKNRNVPFLKPSLLFGNFFDVFIFRKSIALLLWDLYDRFNSPYFGVFVLNKPHIVLRDPEVIKYILVKDFNIFCDRAVTADEDCDPMTSKMLFFLKNPDWKAIRAKMTPVFTTGKMKSMITLVHEAADEMKSYLRRELNKGPIDVREICSKYSTNVITSCAFGINAKSFDVNDGKFRQAGKRMFEFYWQNAIRQACYFLSPDLVKLFKMPFFDPNVSNFLRDIFWRTIDDREKNNFKRNDLIDIISQMRKEGSNDKSVNFEGDTVVAQAAQFFAAGFETVGSTISFALYELCLHPNMQDKLRLEIKNSIAQHGGLTYEGVQNMKYLDMIISETLRKYPALPFLDRKCQETYKVPNTDLVIEKNMYVFISVFGLHYDDRYFPDPKKFDPERFSEENKGSIPHFSYMPFGDGPRNCVGARFGLLVSKLGLAHIISEFKIEKSPDLPIPVRFNTKGFLLAPSSDININFKQVVSN